MNDLVPFAIVVEQYSSDKGSEGLCWTGLGRLTQGWSLIVLKTSLIGSFSGVNRSFNL